MSCKTYLYKGSELTEEELIQVLASDSRIIESYKSQEEREGSDYKKEDRISFEKKVDALKRTMNVEVIYDDNIESSRLLGRNDPRTKAAGKPVILINPNQLFKTTAVHEFGHVFIDSFPGGLENKRLQRALEQLKDTDLWVEVESRYPELSKNMLHKEILVTAIGREGSKIWNDGENQSKWESFIAWFSDYIKRVLGLNRDEVVSLSKELLNNKVKDVSVSKIEEIAQQMKPLYFNKNKENKTDASKKADKLESKIDKEYKKLLNVVSKVYKSQTKKTASAKSKEAANVRKNLQENKGRSTRLESITDLQETLKEFEEADQKQGFMKYLNWAGSEIFFMNNEIDRREENKTLDDVSLRKAYNWNASFNVLDDIQNLLEELRTTGTFTEEEVKTVRDLLVEYNGLRKEIDAKLLKGSREVYSQLLAKHDTETEQRYIEGIKRTYAELESVSPGTTGMQEGEYIIQQMQENKDEIEEEKIELARERAEKSLTRMSTLSMVLLSEKEMKAKDIQLLSTMLDEAQRNIEKFSTEEATNEDAKNKEFVKFSDSRSMKKKYEGMFVTSESGVSYYTGEYKPEFIEEKNRMIREMGDSEIYDEKYKDTQITEKPDNNGSINYYYDSNVLSINSNKPEKRELSFYGGSEIIVEGIEDLKEEERPMHVSYKMENGERMTITLNEAIARSEYKHWKSINIKTVIKNINGKKVVRVLPNDDKWKDPRYAELKEKSPEKFAEMERLKQNNRGTDAMYDKKDSLIEMLQPEGTDNYNEFKKAEFMRLPGVMKTTASRVAEGQSLKTIGENALSRLTETQADDYDVEVHTNFQEGETLRLPSPYRAKLKDTDQSFDLHTIGLLHSIMGKNYQEKKKIESALLVITEVMASKKYPVLDSSGRQKIDAQTKAPIWVSGTESEEYKKSLSLLENRLYGITTKQAGSFKVLGKKVETQQVMKASLKYFGTVSLVFNYANSIVNATTGTFSNLIEAVGGNAYTLKDYKKAQLLYNSDLKEIMKDIGANVASSKTNLLMSNFNTMGPGHLQNNFEEGSRMEALMKQDSLRPLANIGEHMMQAKVMYSLLSAIKSQNKDGQWIDINGKPTSSKDKAASLVDMITFKENSKGGKEMVLHPEVQNTSFTTGGGQKAILLETRNLIRSKVDELHGQYTNDIQSHAQRYMLGKLSFFLRKWMIPGYLRRWRGVSNSFKPSDKELRESDVFYSSDQKEYMEGYYVSTVRFLSKIVSDAREDGINISKSWKELTHNQKAGVKKTMIDIALMTAVILAYEIMEGDGDIDDEDIFLAYLLRRQMSELTTFANPIEAFKIAQTPTAAVGNLKQIFKTMNYMTPWNWGDRYETGPYKNDLKIYHKSKKLLPRFKNNEDFKQSLDFLRTMSM